MLEVQEVARILDDLETRAGCEVALGVADEADVEAAVAVAVQIQRRLWRGSEQRFVLGGKRVVRAGGMESGLVGFTVVAILAGIGAAILPARRASRLNVLDALHYE